MAKSVRLSDGEWNLMNLLWERGLSGEELGELYRILSEAEDARHDS